MATAEPMLAIDPALLGETGHDIKMEDIKAEQLQVPKLEVEEDTDDPMEDLFGDDDAEIIRHDDDIKPALETPDSEPAEQITAEEAEHRRAMEYAEDDENEPEEIHVREAAVSIPRIPKVKSSDGKHWVFRLPNFMKLDSRPFHPQTYVGPEMEDVGTGSSVRERSMSIKLQVENTVRWRWAKDKDGNDIKQSNTRVVRWSDGSMTLQVGKEQFEIQQTIDTSAAPPRAVNGKADDRAPRAQGLTYLVAQHPRSTILQAEAPITGTLTLRPLGMQSETHQMLVRAVSQKHNRVARLRMAPDPVRDPEREKIELLKSQTKKTRKKRDTEDDDLGAGRRRRRNARMRSEQYWSDEDEEADGYGSDEDEEGLTPRRSKPRPGKEANDYQADDFVVSDEGDEDGEGEDDDEIRPPKKRKSSRSAEAGAEPDSLDEMDEKIEKDAARRKKRRAVDGDAVPKVEEPKEDEPMDEDGEGEADVDVDVESEDREEEDNEPAIRKAGTGVRRRLIEEEDEDE